MPASNNSIRFARRFPRLSWLGAGAAGLTAEQDAMLLRWGYPYVFDAWFFHMTLTRRLSTREKATFLPAAEAFFAPALHAGRRVSDLCIFGQAAPDAPFTIVERVSLLG